MRLRRRMPLFDGGDLDWTRFVSKASKGSYKAAEMLSGASFALAAGIAGQRVLIEAPEEEFVEALTSAIPNRFPFTDTQGLLDTLFESGYLHVPIVARQAPFAARPEYGALWKRQVRVSDHQLIHDAALHCGVNWGKEELIRLLAAVEKDGAEYNSQDAVAAMLILVMISGE